MHVLGVHEPGRFLSPALARRLSSLPPPIVIFNKSHSGSRLLARLLREQGIFMGAVLNESEDALPLLRLVEHVVLTYHPDFSSLWGQSPWPEALQQLISDALDEHLAGYQPGTAWGWKLCETTYILPLLAALFPTGRYIHLVRDGRDVAFSIHVAPEQPFWRKIYFGSAEVQSWRGLPLDNATYERHSHLFNARHWLEMTGLGRTYGAMLGPQYRELRFEDLCADLPGEAARLLAWLGHETDQVSLDRLATTVRQDPIGKHRARPPGEQRAVQQIIEPLLLSFGYACTPLPSRLTNACIFPVLARRLSRIAGRLTRSST